MEGYPSRSLRICWLVLGSSSRPVSILRASQRHTTSSRTPGPGSWSFAAVSLGLSPNDQQRRLFCGCSILTAKLT